MRTARTTGTGLELPSPTNGAAATVGVGGGGGGGGRGVDGNWEMRPGGMLVQKRTDLDQNRPPPPTIRVRVKYGSIYHELNISSQATFGIFLFLPSQFIVLICFLLNFRVLEIFFSLFSKGN